MTHGSLPSLTSSERRAMLLHAGPAREVEPAALGLGGRTEARPCRADHADLGARNGVHSPADPLSSNDRSGKPEARATSMVRARESNTTESSEATWISSLSG